MKKTILILSIFVLSSCATHLAWKNKSYQEKISHFLTTNGVEKLVIIGDKYHYIFSNANKLNTILQWEHRKLLKANFDEHFLVTTNNKISGKYKIICDCENTSKAQKAWLNDNGFKRTLEKNKQCTNKKMLYVKEIEVHGDRYLSKNKKFSENNKLNSIYKIIVEEEASTLDNIVNVAETPIAVAADGIFIISAAGIAVALFPITIHNFMQADGNIGNANQACKNEA